MNLPTQDMYLDNNATTKLDPVVAEAMYCVSLMGTANPASQHKAGREARKVLESSREDLARHLGCRTDGMQADQFFFTSGGTESNNLAIFGMADRSPSENSPMQNRKGITVVSSIEHPSVLGAAESIAKRNAKVEFCPVRGDGIVDLDAFAELMLRHDFALQQGDSANQISLVSVMLANNETGVLQPLREIVGMCKPRGILIHTDAVQVLGKLPLSFRDLDVDAMTITAHKVHGPAGIGALVLRSGLRIDPQLFGGFQQLGTRPGTECVMLAVGFEKAVELAVESIDERSSKMLQLRDALETKLLQSPADATIMGYEVDRLPHTTSIAYRGLDRQSLQMALDFAGIACSTGSACASGSGQPSHVLRAMGVDDRLIQGAIRFSLSHQTTAEELTRAASKINFVVETLLAKRSAPISPSLGQSAQKVAIK